METSFAFQVGATENPYLPCCTLWRGTVQNLRPSSSSCLLGATDAQVTQRAAVRKTLSMKRNPLNSPLTEAEICLNSGKSISRWVRKTSSTGSLAAPEEKIYGGGEIGKIVFTFAKPSFRDTTRRF